MRFLKKLALATGLLLLGAISIFGQSATKTLTINVTSGGAAGWQQITGTALTGLCPTYPDIQGNTGCTAVQTAWGAALVDNTRNALVITGGGHGDYFGNEVYRCLFTAINAATCSLLHDASHGSTFDSQLASGWGQAQLGGGSANNVQCPEAVTDSSGSGPAPNARHTFGAFWYLPNTDRYWYNGEGLAGTGVGQCGSFTDGVWSYDPNITSGNPWTQFNLPGTRGTNYPNTQSHGDVPIHAYNPTDGCVYFLENNIPIFWKNCFDGINGVLTSANEAWTNLASPGGAPCDSSNAIAQIDVKRQLYVCAGGGFLETVNLTTFAVTNDSAASGCSTVVSANSPGMAYDPINQVIAFWVGGSNIIEYNASTHACTTLVFSGGPGAIATPNGTMNRFQWMPGIGAFVLANGMNNNLWTLQHVTAAAAANQDFANRVAAAGVTASEGFDSAGEFVPVTSGRGFFKAFGGTSPIMSQDTTIYRSGGGSSLATVPPMSSDQPNGYYAMGFASTVAASNLSVGKQVQFSWAQRFDAAYIQEQAPAIGGGDPTYWKQFIVSWWDGASNFNSCGNPDFVVVNDENKESPLGYAACGDDPFQVSSSLAINGIWNEYNKQLISSGAYNGSTQTLTGGTIPTNNYNCPFINGTVPAAGCAAYPANTWVTYKCEIIQGAFGSAATQFQCWQSTPHSPAWRQWLYNPNHVISQDGTDVYNVLQLQPYWTNRDNTQVPTPNLGTAHTWYDEVVICMGTVSAPCNILPPQAPPAVP